MNTIATNLTNLVVPDWPAPDSIFACTTTRQLPSAQAPAPQTPLLDAYANFNLADHVADDPARVKENRAQLRELLVLPREPIWLSQCHSNLALNLDDLEENDTDARRADASFCSRAGQVCVVLTADCLPVLLCERRGRAVAAIHAGWRGLCDGVIENTVAQMGIDAGDLLAWLGPAIGPEQFEVGDDVRDAFMQNDADAATHFLARGEKYLADLYGLARQRLTKLGLVSISGGQFCSYRDAAQFYSYRRDGNTGRMASLIYINE